MTGPQGTQIFRAFLWGYFGMNWTFTSIEQSRLLSLMRVDLNQWKARRKQNPDPLSNKKEFFLPAFKLKHDLFLPLDLKWNIISLWVSSLPAFRLETCNWQSWFIGLWIQTWPHHHQLSWVSNLPTVCRSQNLSASITTSQFFMINSFTHTHPIGSVFLKNSD